MICERIFLKQTLISSEVDSRVGLSTMRGRKSSHLWLDAVETFELFLSNWTTIKFG